MEDVLKHEHSSKILLDCVLLYVWFELWLDEFIWRKLFFVIDESGRVLDFDLWWFLTWQKLKQELCSLFFNTSSSNNGLDCRFGEYVTIVLFWFIMNSTVFLLLVLILQLLVHLCIFVVLWVGWNVRFINLF